MQNPLQTVLKRYRQASNTLITAVIISILVAALGVLATYIFAHALTQQHNRDFDLAKQQQLQTTTQYIENRLAGYRQVLLGGASILYVRGQDAVSRDDWQTFFRSNQISQRFPNLLGVGYTVHIPAEELSAHTDTIRSEGYPSYQVFPDGKRAEYTAITYIEPFNETNQKAFGYDMFSEAIRKTAMERARDSGDFAMSAPVLLKQDENRRDKARPKSVLVYYPIFTSASVPATVAERRSELKGYVYLAFRIQDMLKDREDDMKALHISYSASDVTGTPMLLHEADASKMFGAKLETATATIPAISRKWNITLTLQDSYLNRTLSPLIMFATGIGASLLLGTVVFLLLTRRLQKVSESHETELQRTKDELLALASHQLRTPATSVRQYTGMLAQGFFGKLSEDQQEIVEKTFAANDRQLEIIDHLLYVAKADAGQLMMQPEDIDGSSLLTEVVEGMENQAAHKKIRIQTTIPPDIHFEADARFLRMTIENLLSNAIKYSYPDSTVLVILSKDQDRVAISISDQGVGISDDDQDKLFQKFSRINNPLSRSEGGSGLGLYLAQKLVQAHGGEVNVRSREGKGTTFTLELPLTQTDSDSVVQLTETDGR